MKKKIMRILIDTLKIGKSGFSGEQQVVGIFTSCNKILKVMEKEGYYFNTDNLPEQLGYIKADSIEICPECNGKKVVWRSKEIEPRVRTNWTAECPTCSGKGWVTNGK